MKSRSTLAAWLRSLDGSRLARLLGTRKDAMSPPEPRSLGELADRLQRPGSVALVLPRLALPHLQVAEALAALGAPVSRAVLAELLGAADGEISRELAAVLEALADHALVWPDGAGNLRMAGPLRQAWDTPLGLDAPLEELLAGTTSDELRGMLAALGVRTPGTKAQRRNWNPRSSSPYCFRHGGTCRSPPPGRATRTTRRFPLSREHRPATAACRPAMGCWPQPHSSRAGRA